MPVNERLTTWMSLGVLTLVYTVGELSHFLLGVTSTPISQDLHYGDHACMRRPNTQNQSVKCYKMETEMECEKFNVSCYWDYSGLGIEYQILAGPSFVFIFTICGVIIGFLADKLNRKIIVAVCLSVLTTATGLTGAAMSYWQLAVLRMLIGAGDSCFTPTCTSMITDMFPKSHCGMALGIFNWGVYFGYGLSYLIGNFVTTADIGGMGWRMSYIVSGVIGIFVTLLLAVFVKDPPKTANCAKLSDSEQEQHNSSRYKTKYTVESSAYTNNASESSEAEQESANVDIVSEVKIVDQNKSTVKVLLSPTIIMLCLAACVRHTAGFTWAYNTQLYFNTYYPEYNLGVWITCDSIFGGSLGVAVGGIVSDKLVKRLGLRARLYVLAASQLLATPFAIGVLYLEPPGAFFSLLGAYIFAEMWFGVMFAVLMDLVPSESRATAVGIFLFVMNNVGGNLPVVVTPLRKATDYRTALLIMYPMFYFLSSILFFITSFTIKS
ncbi:unnamed protein product [Meganyctiphanes norvegica]|uniref:Major facilitator superfamily (MFS) profile domain-containing protein n=1 Tax=Meganyctiphanes norvegica TaxID=48144 RepID=A0AAV2SSS6_MEGNR